MALGSGFTHRRFSGTEGDIVSYLTHPQELITDSTSDLYIQFVSLSQLTYSMEASSRTAIQLTIVSCFR